MKAVIINSVLLLGFGIATTAQGQTPQFTISTVAGDGAADYTGDGGAATSAALNVPRDVAVDAAGNLYVADFHNNCIRKVTPGGVITTVAGTGTAGFGGDGGQATKALLNLPSGVAFDAAGNLYIADTYNYRIRKVTTAGVITTVAGNGNSGFSGDGGAATSAMISSPEKITFDQLGNLFIASALEGTGSPTPYGIIRRVDTSGIITTIAGKTTAGFSGDGGAATSAQLNSPAGLAVSSAGDLYIADGGNQRIRKVSNGIITTVAGNGTAGFSGDGGAATAAEFNTPQGIAFDSAGNLYISDQSNQRIRVLLANGTMATVAGNGVNTFAGDEGPATLASLTSPRSVAVSGTSVYIADGLNNRVRLLTAIPQPPTINVSGVVPVFSAATTIQPGSWISIYGTGLATAVTVWNGDFPKKLGSTTVTINGKLAYLWFVSPTQINMQAPDDATRGPVPVVVTTPYGSFTSTVTLSDYGPSFSLFNTKYAAAIVPTSGPGNSGAGYDLIGPMGGLPFTTRPVKAGETLLLYGVGFGPTIPVFPAGQATSGAAQSVTYPQITIGGVTAQVTFAGIVEAGLYQFNVVVPNAPSGDQPLVAMIGGQTTPGNVYLTIQ